MATASVESIIYLNGNCFCRIYNLFKWQLLLSTINFSSNILILSAQQNNISQKVEFSKKKRLRIFVKNGVGNKVSERGEMKSGGHKKRRWRL